MRINKYKNVKRAKTLTNGYGSHLSQLTCVSDLWSWRPQSEVLSQLVRPRRHVASNPLSFVIICNVLKHENALISDKIII